jgi:RimJ/RimL family protein N-acetyltransferase
VDDVNNTYLSWLDDFTAIKYINATKNFIDIHQLKIYVKEKLLSSDVHFFGIFLKESNVHIGNIKYEPVNRMLKYAVVGVLIGDISWRGKGVFGEVFPATIDYLLNLNELNKIYLGVDKGNSSAIKSYVKSGFSFTDKHPLEKKSSTQVMVFNIVN